MLSSVSTASLVGVSIDATTLAHSLIRCSISLLAAISQETMTIHHSKHHNTYVTNLNAGLEKLDAAMSANDVSAIIGLQGALKFNGK
jgi:hypothetical protein